MNYQLIKAFHIIFVVCWFAGLFYIFRLFVYHVENWDKNDVVRVMKTMEGRLLNMIMTPAMILTIIFGVWLIVLNPMLIKQPWMHIKLTIILFLIVYHLYSYHVYFCFLKNKKILTSKACRIINEVPTIILISVCILAFLKPTFQ